MNTEQFEYQVKEDTNTEQSNQERQEESNKERQEESKKIEKRTRERLPKDRYIKKTIDIEIGTEKKLMKLAEFYKLNQRLTLDLIINAMYKEKIREEKEKYKETLEEQVRRLLNERNEIMANQAELLNKFIDLQKEVDNKIENRFNIESTKIETRLIEHKETIDNHYRKIGGTISNLKIDELKRTVISQGKELTEIDGKVEGLIKNKNNKTFW